ncbi:pirin family protein [Motiliproteus sp. MSK22-1]|uniref:pirin family protein n=1 Tax=Motiliproteus sp. MSK22-1 TaxID=1897630 RepID=UPI00097625B3|nr:pirin family protein [Motiliproteus sp. MSK22-1]OMH32666.1 quercetin 2,3-dioxygenase [Motiliproteus sp. MSK22-1]
MKKIVGVYSAPRTHWVGNGFPVRSLFSYNTQGQSLSPFLLLDRAGPAEFDISNERRGVGQHPHRGFETVTLVYKGEVAHRDSTDEGGVIGPGDVQWMTAASGILHEEYHSEAFGREGGTLDMVQLWVNLPAKDKMSPPGYQAIQSKDIPTVSLMDNAGTARVIAGEYEGHKGPAKTFTPMTVLDLQLTPGVTVDIPVPEGWSTAVIVLHGSIQVNSDTTAREADLVVLSQSQRDLSVMANGDASVLLLSGEPIDEPVVGYGPFVMNSEEEIAVAVEDFNSGRFGNID